MILRDIQLYYPDNKVPNSYYYERFPEKRERVEKLLTALCKEFRFISQEETSLEMGIHAVEKLMEETKIDKNDVGAILFASQTPEYLIPTNSVLIHKALEFNEECMCMDLNANCAGMPMALEHAQNYLLANPECKYVILVGAERNSVHSSKDCLMTYTVMGDLACAVLLEQSNERTFKAIHRTSSQLADKILFPANGLSTINKQSENYIYWGLLGGSIEETFGPSIERAKKLMEEQNITNEDIGLLVCNQQTYNATKFLTEKLGIPINQTCYVGDQYGYTGSTTSFVSLYHGIKEKGVERGKYILFCSAGAGGVLVTALLKY